MNFVRCLTLMLVAIVLGGCASSSPNSSFVKSTNFSSLGSFSFKHTLISGFDWRAAEEMALEELSDEVLTAALRERGFEQVETGGDFYVVAKWTKAVSSQPSIFDSVDGPMAEINDRNNPSYRFAPRLNLVVELYETETRDLFWREELSNIFDANEFTDERVIAALRRAIRDFPERVEKDPNLPDIRPQ